MVMTKINLYLTTHMYKSTSTDKPVTPKTYTVRIQSWWVTCEIYNVHSETRKLPARLLLTFVTTTRIQVVQRTRKLEAALWRP